MLVSFEEINSRPLPFEFYTAAELWTNEYTAHQMLGFHLNESVDAASRNAKFIDRSIEWIVSYFGVDKNTRIADFGCGPGLYMNRLAEYSSNALGIDFSENSLAYAKKKATSENLDTRYLQANYLQVELNEKFDLIIMIMCDFCVLSPGQRKQLLTKFYSLLNKGGSLLIDVYSLSSFDQKEESRSHEHISANGFWSGNEHDCYLNTFKYEQEKISLDKHTIVEESQLRTIYNWFQYFSVNSITKELNEAGLKLDNVYSDVAGAAFNPDSAEFAVIAKRR